MSYTVVAHIYIYIYFYRCECGSIKDKSRSKTSGPMVIWNGWSRGAMAPLTVDPTHGATMTKTPKNWTTNWTHN